MCLGVPGRVAEIWDDAGTRMATVDFGGVTKTICLAYVPDADVGDYACFEVTDSGVGIFSVSPNVAPPEEEKTTRATPRRASRPSRSWTRRILCSTFRCRPT